MRTIRQRAALATAGAAAFMTLAGVSTAFPVSAHATQGTVSAAVAQKVTIKVSAGTAAKGQRLIISGTAWPRAKVTVQASTGKTWQTIATTRATRAGEFTTSIAHVGGNAQYRVVATTSGLSSTSPTRRVAGTSAPQKFKLSDYMKKPDSLRGTTGSINSVGYEFTVGVYVDRSVSWDLQGCTHLSAKIGVDNTFTANVNGTRYTGSTAVDGDNVLNKTMTRDDDAFPVEISLKGSRRLTFSHASKDAAWGRFAFANATVTCTTPPAKAS